MSGTADTETSVQGPGTLERFSEEEKTGHCPPEAVYSDGDAGQLVTLYMADLRKRECDMCDNRPTFPAGARAQEKEKIALLGKCRGELAPLMGR